MDNFNKEVTAANVERILNILKTQSWERFIEHFSFMYLKHELVIVVAKLGGPSLPKSATKTRVLAELKNLVSPD